MPPPQFKLPNGAQFDVKSDSRTETDAGGDDDAVHLGLDVDLPQDDADLPHIEHI